MTMPPSSSLPPHSNPPVTPNMQAGQDPAIPWWTTDLSTGLSLRKWSTIIFLGLTIFLIPLAVFLYFFWKRQLICTMSITPTSIALYQSSGRKLHPKVSKYYFNRQAIATVSGTTTAARKRGLLILLFLMLVYTIAVMIENISSGVIMLILTGAIGLLFFLWTSRHHLSGFNLDSLGPIGGNLIGSVQNQPYSILARIRDAIKGESVPSTDETVKQYFSVETARATGLIALSQMAMVTFLGHDIQAGKCFNDLKQGSFVIPLEMPPAPTREAPPMTVEQMLFCPNCGVRNESGSNFCFHCGTKLST